MAEDSRPCHQFKKEERKKNKPAGRKQEHEYEQAKKINWFAPFLWQQIINAATRAGKPWSPRRIVNEAKKSNITIFDKLSEQVLGRWIDPEAKKCGVSKWKDTVLEQVKKGNSPRGETTQAGILVRYQPVPIAHF